MSREGDQLIVTPLGAGNEVGRSCVYMSFRGKTILVHFPPFSNSLFLLLLLLLMSLSVLQFDCGINPAYSGMAALPYFDEIDPSTIDVLLITQYVHFPPSDLALIFLILRDSLGSVEETCWIRM